MTPEEKHSRRIKRAHIRRQILIRAMGGKCEECGSEQDLEFHHTEPRQWIAANLSRWQRQVYYEDDYWEGKLKLLCSTCNKKNGVPSDDDVPF